jgi:hypothetical protein
MWILTKIIIEIYECNHEGRTSIGKMKFDEAENGHEFELRTITEKSTRGNSTNIIREFYHTDTNDLLIFAIFFIFNN